MDTASKKTKHQKVTFSAQPSFLGAASSSSEIASTGSASDKPRSILRNRTVDASSINIDGSTHAVTDANTSVNKQHSKVILGRRRPASDPIKEVQELNRYRECRVYDPDPEGSKKEAKHYKYQMQSRMLHPKDQASLDRYYDHMHAYYSSVEEEGDNRRKTRITKRFDRQNNRHKALMKKETLPLLSKPDAISKEQRQLEAKVRRSNRPLSSKIAGASRNVTLPLTQCVTSVRQARRRIHDGIRQDLDALKTRIEQRSWGR
ncbi:MAG: hypothetical protein MK137_02070 [Rickettsiales bacterium]|nr:hypothetical protein [Rickettsiales bacterium]